MLHRPEAFVFVVVTVVTVVMNFTTMSRLFLIEDDDVVKGFFFLLLHATSFEGYPALWPGKFPIGEMLEVECVSRTSGRQ